MSVSGQPYRTVCIRWVEGRPCSNLRCFLLSRSLHSLVRTLTAARNLRDRCVLVSFSPEWPCDPPPRSHGGRLIFKSREIGMRLSGGELGRCRHPWVWWICTCLCRCANDKTPLFILASVSTMFVNIVWGQVVFKCKIWGEFLCASWGSIFVQTVMKRGQFQISIF